MLALQMKPLPTRKLRRRPNDPVPAQEKRRKPVSNQLNFQLDEKQMDDDLRLIAKGKLPTQQPAKKSSTSSWVWRRMLLGGGQKLIASDSTVCFIFQCLVRLGCVLCTNVLSVRYVEYYLS